VVLGWIPNPFHRDESPNKTPATNTLSAQPAREAVVRYTENKGLNTFLGPANTYGRGTPSNLAEGTVINVVCQSRHGQEIYDPEGDPNRYKQPWPVWDRLNNGVWVSDLYVDLPKVPGESSPPGIPRC
jgi:hypothetical protein